MFTSIDTSAVKDAYNSIIISGLKGIESSDELLNPYYQEEMMTISAPIKDSAGSVIGVALLHSSIADLSSSMDSFFLYLISGVVQNNLNYACPI